MTIDTKTPIAYADLLKYADLQMAAEAFLEGNLKDALVLGNGHSSKFTPTQAARFLEYWEVVEQKPNTTTGFSATVFKALKDDPLTGAKAGGVIGVRSCLLLPSDLNQPHVPPSAHRVSRRLLPRHLAGGSAGGHLWR